MSHQMSQGRDGEVQGPTGIQAEDLSHTICALPAFYNRVAIDINFEKKIQPDESLLFHSSSFT